jgi:hypothetical protein
MGKIKKKLLNYTKTKHFQKRQIEREVSDKDLLQAFKEGEIKEVEGSFRVTLGHLNIILDFESGTLITVHPGDPAKAKPKVFSKAEASALKLLIEARKINEKATAIEDEFLKFVKENAVKKLK